MLCFRDDGFEDLFSGFGFDLSRASRDNDSDGLEDQYESRIGTQPTSLDSDGDRYGDFDEVLTLQSEVASDIARQVQMTLAPHADARRAGGRPMNPQVYELVLKGRYEWGQLTATSNERAKRFYEQALAIDPKDARANSGLADAYLKQKPPEWASTTVSVELDEKEAAELRALGYAVD